VFTLVFSFGHATSSGSEIRKDCIIVPIGPIQNDIERVMVFNRDRVRKLDLTEISLLG